MNAGIDSAIVLIPALNAATSLRELVSRLRTVVGEIPILLVDDGSTDHTAELARALQVTVLQHKINEGKGAALQTGFTYVWSKTRFDLILTMDADLQHQPEDIPKFFQRYEQTKADLILGYRARKGTAMPLHRRLSNTLTSMLVSKKTGMNIIDSQCGFRLIHRKVFGNIQLETKRFEAETEFLMKAARLGITLESVPVQTVYENEKSHMTHWATTMNFIKVLLRDYA